MIDTLVYSDIHHDAPPSSMLLENGQNALMVDRLNTQQNIFNYILHNPNIRVVFFLGDLFNTKDKIQVSVYNAVYDMFTRFFKAISEQNREIMVFANVGNHDLINSYGITTDNSIHGLSHLIKILDTESAITVSNTTFYTIPYKPTKEEFIQSMEKVVSMINPNSNRVLLLHQGVNGMDIGSDFVFTSKEDVTMEDIKPSMWNCILSGHYHKPQRINNFYYIGSPLELSWGEISYQHGIMLLDSTNLDIQFMPTQYPTRTKILTDKPEEVTMIVEDYISKEKLLRSDLIKINTSNPDIFEEYKEVFHTELHTELLSNIDEKPIQSIQDDSELLDRYIKSINVSSYDTQYLLKVGLEILNESKNLSE